MQIKSDEVGMERILDKGREMEVEVETDGDEEKRKMMKEVVV